MTDAERIVWVNRWYDSLPAEWRFHAVLWPVLVAGALNMMMTVAVGFPFGLLVLAAIICIAAIRVPYVLGRFGPVETTVSADRPMRWNGRTGWLIELNQRYDALPELRRLWLVPAVLTIAGAINMLLTISASFPFGLLFLLALLAIVAVRAPYVQGWIKRPEPVAAVTTSVPTDSVIALTHEATEPSGEPA